MTRTDGDMPGDWDALAERGEGGAAPPEPSPGQDPTPPALALMASSWADLVVMLAVCTGSLIAVLALGQRPALPAFGWAAGLAILWWAFAAAALVVVRQGTPGMLLAGVRFREPVAASRLPYVLLAALFGVVTLGSIGALGARISPLAAAAATELESDDSI